MWTDAKKSLSTPGIRLSDYFGVLACLIYLFVNSKTNYKKFNDFFVSFKDLSHYQRLSRYLKMELLKPWKTLKEIRGNPDFNYCSNRHLHLIMSMKTSIVQIGGWGRRSPFTSSCGISRAGMLVYGVSPYMNSSHSITPVHRNYLPDTGETGKNWTNTHMNSSHSITPVHSNHLPDTGEN